MSLINEALKKAQSQRAEGSAVDYQSATATGPRRGRAPKGNLYVLLGSGAVLLVVLSVVLTVFLVNRPTARSTAAAASGSAPAPTSMVAPAEPGARNESNLASQNGNSGAAPSFVLPGLTTKKETTGASTKSLIAPAPVQTASSAAPAVATSASPIAAASAPAPAPTTAATGPGSFDQQVAAFVEAIHVTGIRSSGNESRVLMNDRVYRVNDIVERSLGVKLIKVAADTLTFVDAQGVTYEKYF